MITNLPKKIVGTLVLLSLAAVGFFLAAPDIRAQFIDPRGSLIFDGTVSSTTPTTVTLLTDGTAPITVNVTNKTVFTGGKKLADLVPGDSVKVIARDTSSNPQARVIQTNAGSGGYGNAGDMAFVANGRITAKTASSITVQTDSATVTYRITSSTRFIRSSLASLNIGDRVQIIGRDSGSDFVARFVLRR